ncbi:MAG: ABC transporter substrate-binding protein [Hyphomicrobiaceae bacterium]
MAFAILLPTGPAALAQPSPKPQRIVSINLCTDQILLDLVPRARIRALSMLAADPAVSAAAEKAAGIATTRGDAETVLGFDPDLVLAGTFSTPATVSLLERIGQRVEKIGLASDIAGIRTTIRQIAAAVGEREKGEALIDGLDRALEGTRRDAGAAKPSALIYQVNGLTAGSGNIADAMLRAAGFANHATHLQLGHGGSVPLESVVADPPDLLVLSGSIDEYRTVVADNVRHPALAALRRERPSVVVPWRYWLCGTHHLVTAIRQLSIARQQFEAESRPR